MGFLNTTLEHVLNILFPVKCLSCGESGSDLCVKCLSDISAAERECAEWIYPIYDYRNPVIKNALWALKYSNKKNLAKTFADVLYARIVEELSELAVMQNFHNAILIPIPLSPERRRERGYNQAELICDELMKINTLNSGLSLTLQKNILIKPKDTEHQARIKNRNIRLKNVVGSFAIKNPEENFKLLAKRNIILIDDITTTGATLSEAKKVLKQAGARKIIAFTVAH